jgi:four helix bundle protein
MRDFRELTVWQKAHALALSVYKISSEFPRFRAGGLSSQMQRAALSLAMTIAEAASKNDRIDFTGTLRTALGWANQLEYQFLLSRDLNLVESSVYEKLQFSVVEVKKMLNGLCRASQTPNTKS